MLPDNEKNSLKMIFERVNQERITGVVETLLECYKNQYADSYSLEIINILEPALIKMKKVKL